MNLQPLRQSAANGGQTHPTVKPLVASGGSVQWLNRLPGRAASRLPCDFPSAAVLARLAISDSGFLFDPVGGQSFSLNETALFVLRLARTEQKLDALLDALTAEFDGDRATIERDLRDFAARLGALLK